MSFLRWSLYLCLGTLGCRSWPSASEPNGPEVDLQVRLLGSLEVTRSLAPCHTLKRSDSVELVVRSRSGAYVYVFARDESKTIRLFPAADQPAPFLNPGQRLRLPTEPTKFYRAEEAPAGEQQLLAFSTKRPLDASLCQALGLPCEEPSTSNRGRRTRGDDSADKSADEKKDEREAKKTTAPADPPHPTPDNRPGKLLPEGSDLWVRSVPMNSDLGILRYDLCVDVPRAQCECQPPD